MIAGVLAAAAPLRGAPAGGETEEAVAFAREVDARIADAAEAEARAAGVAALPLTVSREPACLSCAAALMAVGVRQTVLRRKSPAREILMRALCSCLRITPSEAAHLGYAVAARGDRRAFLSRGVC